MNNIIYYLKLAKLSGLIGAVRFFFDKKKKNKIIRLWVKSLPHPIYLRTRTSDIYTFSDLLLGNHNHLSKMNMQSAKVIIDAGANIGITTILYATAFPHARIIAIEPEAGNFEMLKKNTASYSNIQIVQKALWYTREKLEISNPEAANWAFTTGAKSNGSIESLTIEDLFPLAQTDKIDYLKIDVEGAEKEIFEHVDPSLLKKIRFIGIELHDRVKPGCSKSFYTKLSQLSFNELRNFSGDHIVEINNESV